MTLLAISSFRRHLHLENWKVHSAMVVVAGLVSSWLSTGGVSGLAVTANGLLFLVMLASVAVGQALHLTLREMQSHRPVIVWLVPLVVVLGLIIAGLAVVASIFGPDAPYFFSDRLRVYE